MDGLQIGGNLCLFSSCNTTRHNVRLLRISEKKFLIGIAQAQCEFTLKLDHGYRVRRVVSDPPPPPGIMIGLVFTGVWLIFDPWPYPK